MIWKYKYLGTTLIFIIMILEKKRCYQWSFVEANCGVITCFKAFFLYLFSSQVLSLQRFLFLPFLLSHFLLFSRFHCCWKNLNCILSLTFKDEAQFYKLLFLASKYTFNCASLDLIYLLQVLIELFVWPFLSNFF